MKIIDEREMQKKKNKDKRIKGTKAMVKVWKLIDVVVHLSFLKLMCKGSLIFKSNLEVALWIILK